VTQQFYMITELAAELGVSPRTLRYYESLGLVAPSRLGVMRVYTPEERLRLRMIVRAKRLGFSLLQIKQFLDHQQVDPTRKGQIDDLLAAVRRCVSKESERKALPVTSKGFT
jgi:DNA-binding transcriptional MerR regulator